MHLFILFSITMNSVYKTRRHLYALKLYENRCFSITLLCNFLWEINRFCTSKKQMTLIWDREKIVPLVKVMMIFTFLGKSLGIHDVAPFWCELTKKISMASRIKEFIDYIWHKFNLCLAKCFAISVLPTHKTHLNLQNSKMFSQNSFHSVDFTLRISVSVTWNQLRS